MKSEMRFEIVEKKKLFKKVEGMTNVINKEARDVLTKHALLLEKQAKLNVTMTGDEHPQVQTGRLRASITHVVGREGKDIVGKVGTNVEYAPHLEFGTVKMQPYPWLYPALKTIQPGFLAEIKKFVSKGVRNWWRK